MRLTKNSLLEHHTTFNARYPSCISHREAFALSVMTLLPS